MAAPKKSIVIRVTPEFHQQLKVFTASNGVTIQDYILKLIKKDQKEKGVGVNG